MLMWRGAFVIGIDGRSEGYVDYNDPRVIILVERYKIEETVTHCVLACNIFTTRLDIYIASTNRSNI